MDLAPRTPGVAGQEEFPSLSPGPDGTEPAGHIVDELPRDPAAAMPVVHRPAEGLLVQPLPVHA